MSVNAISSAMAATVYIQRNSMISEELYDKLIELGINPLYVHSDSQAKRLIENIVDKAGSSFVNSSVTSSEVSSTGDVQNSAASDSVRERAEKLADKVNVNYDDSTLLEDLIEDIQDAIDELLVKSAKYNDEGLYDIAEGYMSELNEIIKDVPYAPVSEETVYSFMELLGQYNKQALNIEQK